MDWPFSKCGFTRCTSTEVDFENQNHSSFRQQLINNNLRYSNAIVSSSIYVRFNYCVDFICLS